MAAFDDDCLHAGILQNPRRAFGVLRVVHIDAGQHLRFGQVGRQHVGQRQQMPLHRRHRRIVQQRRAAFGYHHGVEHHRAETAFFQAFGHTFDDFRRSQHTEFEGADLEIVAHGFNLAADNLGRHEVHRRHAERVLRRYRGYGAGAEHAAHLKGFQIRLNARAAAGIRACDG